MAEWYSRPVLFVANVPASIEFYTDKLGFVQDWKFEEQGKTLVSQISRTGCELILSSQWPAKVGNGMMFISLDAPVFDALWPELQSRGADVKDGRWGYVSKIVTDPDGNELYFPQPDSGDPT